MKYLLISINLKTWSSAPEKIDFTAVSITIDITSVSSWERWTSYYTLGKYENLKVMVISLYTAIPHRQKPVQNLLPINRPRPVQCTDHHQPMLSWIGCRSFTGRWVVLFYLHWISANLLMGGSDSATVRPIPTKIGTVLPSNGGTCVWEFGDFADPCKKQVDSEVNMLVKTRTPRARTHRARTQPHKYHQSFVSRSPQQVFLTIRALKGGGSCNPVIPISNGVCNPVIPISNGL